MSVARRLLTTAEAVEYCGFKSVSGLHKAHERGRVSPAGRRGGTGTYMWRISDLDRYLSKQSENDDGRMGEAVGLRDSEEPHENGRLPPQNGRVSHEEPRSGSTLGLALTRIGCEKGCAVFEGGR